MAAGKKGNWVDQTGGLPPLIKRMSRSIRQKHPEMTEGHSIAIAVNSCKRMCSTGDTNFPGAQQVGPKARADACAAVAQWEERKKAAKADND